MSRPPRTIRELCLQVLRQGELEAKLQSPRDAEGRLLPDAEPGPAGAPDRPARSAGLAMGGGAEPLPRPGELAAAEARTRCLARFAHHELMAVELFAWALLAWPEAPPALRRGLVGALEEEQLHTRLYLSRLAAHGSDLGEHRHSDYFWRQVPAIAASPRGIAAFLAGVGLTLEQANLDFTLVYRDGFREGGDAASGAVCQRVHDDEIGHVRLAAGWLGGALDPIEPAGDLRTAYLASVPFPLSAARAKGRRFDVASRRAAGLDEDFIAFVRAARSSQELAGGPGGASR